MKIKRFAALLLCFVMLLSTAAYAAGGAWNVQTVDPYKTYTYEQMCSDLKALEKGYPDLISVSSIGQSVEGRDIPVFRLGKGERQILICASMHAREYIATGFVMYMAEQYCISYRNDSWTAGISYKKMLDGVTFVIVPMLNPDGVILAQNGIENAANRDTLEKMELVDDWDCGYYAWKANINGVDLNRNWPYRWSENDEVKSPASANYNGTAPCTEPEVIAMKKLIDETPFYMFCSFHTSGQVVYWIDNSNTQEMVNKFAPIISKISSFIGYTMLGYENVDKFGGYMINYARATYDKPCFTVELCPMYVDYPYSTYDYFHYTVQRVLPIGLIMAFETLKMEEIQSPEVPPFIENTKIVQVHVDGVALNFEDVGPRIENGRTLVPLRAVCETIGLQVSWSEDKLISVTNGETTVSMRAGEKEICINGESFSLDVAPKIIDGRTLLPIRAVLEAFGCSLEWNESEKIVNVITKSINPDIVIEE